MDTLSLIILIFISIFTCTILIIFTNFRPLVLFFVDLNDRFESTFKANHFDFLTDHVRCNFFIFERFLFERHFHLVGQQRDWEVDHFFGVEFRMHRTFNRGGASYTGHACYGEFEDYQAVHVLAWWVHFIIGWQTHFYIFSRIWCCRHVLLLHYMIQSLESWIELCFILSWKLAQICMLVP